MSKKREVEILDAVLTNLSSKKLLEIVLKKIQSESGLELNQLIKIFQETKGEISVPLSVFSSNLQPAESLCKYLRENENLSYKEIADLINRNEKSIWATYQRAKKKKSSKAKPLGHPGGVKQKYLKVEEKYLLPISIFQDRSYSLLESVVLHLNRVYNLSNRQISQLLRKSPNSIAVLMKRARSKYEK